MHSERYSASVVKAVNELDQQIQQWQTFQQDYAELKVVLSDLPKKTKHHVMVPIGNLAYMPGKLIHTNEIMALLGDNWFVEKSASAAVSVVERRLQYVEENLQKLQEQKGDFEARKVVASGTDTRQSINDKGDALNEEGLPFIDIHEELNGADEVPNSSVTTSKQLAPSLADGRAFLDAIFANATDDSDDEEETLVTKNNNRTRPIANSSNEKKYVNKGDENVKQENTTSIAIKSPADIHKQMLITQQQKSSPTSVSSSRSILRSSSSNSLPKRNSIDKFVHFSQENLVKKELFANERDNAQSDNMAYDNNSNSTALQDIVKDIAEREVNEADTLSNIDDQMHMLEIAHKYQSRKQQLYTAHLGQHTNMEPRDPEQPILPAFNAPFVGIIRGKTWRELAEESLVHVESDDQLQVVKEEAKSKSKPQSKFKKAQMEKASNSTEAPNTEKTFRGVQEGEVAERQIKPSVDINSIDVITTVPKRKTSKFKQARMELNEG